MKKLICIMTVFVLVFSFPLMSNAENPSDDDYRVSVEYADDYNYMIKSWSGNVEKRGTLTIGQEFIYSGNYTYGIRLYLGFNIGEYIGEYLSLIQNASSVWVGITFHTRLGFLPNDMLNSKNKLETSFTINNTTSVVETLDFGGSYMGNYSFTPFKLPNNKDLTSSDVVESGFEFYCHTGTPLELREIFLQMVSFTITLYLEGIDGQSYEQFIVITNKMDGVESSVVQLKDEVKVMQGQLGNIEDSINQGFDGVLTPNVSDKVQSDKFGSGMSDKVEQGGNILEDMGQMQKPDIDSVIGDDILSDNEADSMITLMDTVQPILGSALFGRTLLISLILALVAYIFYGKR